MYMEQVQIKGRLRIKTFTDGKWSVGDWQDNLVVEADTHGLNRFIRALANESVSLAITHGKLGTGTTAPTVDDTDIETVAVANVEIANRTIVDNTTVLIEFFISDAFLPEDTYTEFGTFIGDKMFSRALLDTPYEKVGVADIAIDYEFVISNVA